MIAARLRARQISFYMEISLSLHYLTNKQFAQRQVNIFKKMCE